MKQLNTLKCFLIGMIVFSQVGCKLESIQDPIIVTNIEKAFYINLWEELYPNNRNLRIDIQSLKNQPCVNYTIAYDWAASDKKFELSINDIVEPIDCILGLGPATAKIDVGDLESRIFNMSIGLEQTVINNGQLIVDGESYTIQMETEEGIIIPEKILRKVPPQSAWGFVAFQNTADQITAGELLSTLKSQGEPILLKEGKYGYFSFLDNKLLVNGAPVAGQASSFLISFNGDEKELKQVVDNFRSQHNGSVTVKVFTAKGSVF